MENWTRRKFCWTTIGAGLAASAHRLLGGVVQDAGTSQAASSQTKGARPIIISAHNGLKHLDLGMDVLRSGGDALDAILAVVTKVEDDPNDNTVGYGGLPNEDGVVQLDACVMHGPTHRAGAVGAIEKIKNPSLVARMVMERTNHTFLVGPGATKFAIDEGFQPMNLLTDKSRTAWLAWKTTSSKDWRPGLDSPEWKATLSALLDTPEKMAWRDWIQEVVTHRQRGPSTAWQWIRRGIYRGQRRHPGWHGRFPDAWATRRLSAPASS